MRCSVEVELAALSRGCMSREHFPRLRGAVAAAPSMSSAVSIHRFVYIMHHPRLISRRTAMESWLTAADTTAEVTWVLCANREDVDAFSHGTRSCLVQPVPAYSSRSLGNGTVSLALKHALAYWDMRMRRLPTAVMLEDDAAIPANFWRLLMQPFCTIPQDAHIFWLGGGHRGLSLRNGSHVALSGTPFCATSHLGPSSYDALLPAPSVDQPACVVRRNLWTVPSFIGSVAYIMTQTGAEAMRGWPVRGLMTAAWPQTDRCGLARAHTSTHLCWSQSARSRCGPDFTYHSPPHSLYVEVVDPQTPLRHSLPTLLAGARPGRREHLADRHAVLSAGRGQQRGR